MATKNDSPVYYVTHYSHNNKNREYRTKALTPFHAHIRKVYPKAYTVQCDTSIPFPLGVFSVIIARGQVEVAS